MSSSKYPELTAVLNALAAERKAILDRTASLRAEHDKILTDIAPLLARARELEKAFRAVEMPRLGEIDNQVAALAKVLGARAVGTEPAAG